MQPEGYGSIPMDLHISQQGYHPYYRKGHEESPGPPVVQTRILEMRKEKSRDAARSRRGKENFEFYELAKMLPLPGAITTQLDKASIIRLTISFLKLKDFVAHQDPPWRRDGPSLKGGTLRSRSIATDLFEQHQATHILQSLDGFAFALGNDGRFLYVSETVSIYLGLSQVEMTGSSFFDYIHQQDQAELADAIGINVCHSPTATSPASVVSDEGSSSNPGTSTPTGFDRPPPLMTINNQVTSHQGLRRSFCVRMKSTLTKRGCHFKTSGYRVVLILASLRPQYSYSTARKTPPCIMGLVGVAIALPPPSVNELRLEQDMFVTRLTFDFRISHCEPRVSELLEFSADEITGRNMYSLCHAQDAEMLRKCHADLIQKGQVVTSYYRLMNKNGGYVWLQSCATVICNTKNAEEETIICVNYVLSNVEYEHCIMDYAQLPSSRELRTEEPSSSERGSTTPDKDGGRDNTTTGDVDRDHNTPRSDRTEGKEGDHEHFDHASDKDIDDKQDQLHGNSKSSPAREQRGEEFPGCVYLGTDELNTLNVGGDNNNSSGSSQIDTLEEEHVIDVSRSSRHRKRKHVECIEHEPSKSPKSRPGSTTSSSLEVLSLDNGNYLQNENDDDQRLQMAAPTQGDSLPPQLDQPNSVESNNNNNNNPSDKNDKSANVTRPWTRSPVSVSSPLNVSYHTQQQHHVQEDVDSIKNGTSSNASSGMSVRELEDAMNRHLPHNSSSPTDTSPEVLMLKSYATATGGAPNPQHAHHPSTRQSIQWISGGAPATLPATTLLRQIYVSRESVIRSGAHASRSSGGGCYGSDVHQGTLPTPPGGQGEPTYGDTAQLMLQSAAKLSAADAAAAYGVISGFASGVSGGYVDSCNAMTPPSSVSPRDKFNSDATSAFNEAAAVAAAAAIPHMRHYVTTDPNSLQHLPLKHPQLFVHPGNLEHHHGSYGHPQQTLSPDQHQLYHHPSSFHLYHPTPGGSKPSLHATNGASWFCQPHS